MNIQNFDSETNWIGKNWNWGLLKIIIQTKFKQYYVYQKKTKITWLIKSDLEIILIVTFYLNHIAYIIPFYTIIFIVVIILT